MSEKEEIRWPGSAGLNPCYPERGHKAVWNAEELDRDVPSGWRTRIASQPLCPREARVRALRTGEDRVCGGRRSGGRRRQADLDALLSHQLDTGAPVCSATPVLPEKRFTPDAERMQEHADLARLFGGAPIPLALFTQLTGTTTANAGGVHQP